VFASGADIRYQWQKDGVDIPGATDDTLALPAVTIADEAIYRVLVYNITDTITSRNASFRLLVKGPYGGTRHAIPGTIQVEDYDEGGEGVGYHDSDPGNNGGGYRNDDVDIGGTSIGWTANNEWLNYSVTVAQDGNYQVQISAASPNAVGATGRISLLMDGISIASNIQPPSTGGWSTFQSVYVFNIPLVQGDHDLRVFINNGGFNLDYIAFSTPSGIIDKKGTGISLFPNPSAESFTITLDAIKPGAHIILSSVDGKEVLNTPITETSFTFGANLKAGFYIGRIMEGDKVRVFEVVKF
jgi:hypothetical protein